MSRKELETLLDLLAKFYDTCKFDDFQELISVSETMAMVNYELTKGDK